MTNKTLFTVKGIVQYANENADFGSTFVNFYTTDDWGKDLLKHVEDAKTINPKATLKDFAPINLEYMRLVDLDVEKFKYQVSANAKSDAVNYMDINQKPLKLAQIKSGDEIMVQCYVDVTTQNNIRIKLVKVIKLRGSVYTVTKLSKSVIDAGDASLLAQLQEEKKSLSVEI